MIKIENTDVYGWESAIRGMRNPMNSWDKSDSCYKNESVRTNDLKRTSLTTKFIVGRNDLKLMKTLANAGSDHGKFLRMINVTLDITAPLYWWKEFDTYKVGTVANSCSTMHKIQAKEFEWDDFSCEHLEKGSEVKDYYPCNGQSIAEYCMGTTIHTLNVYRKDYLKTKDKKYWWQMIQLLPSSYNQKRTVQLNYAVLKNIYHARKNHKLDEWHYFCDWIEELPYAKELIIGLEVENIDEGN